MRCFRISFSRIIDVADVYDTLTSGRPYRRAFGHEKAVDIIRPESGSQFDPEIAESFLDERDLFRRIRVFGDFQEAPETMDDLLRGRLKVDLSDLELGQ